MRRVARLIVLYSLFAALATLANLAVQAICIAIYSGPHSIPISIFAGTASGLPIKYVLEKRHIFAFKSESLAHDGRLFVLYSAMGVFTTALFWGVEGAFQWVFGTDLMRYVGGAIGLTAGYVIKYQLDRRFVFITRPVQRKSGVG